MGETVCESLIDRVRGEYREMPGLKLTVAQACRLWQIDQPTCEAMLDRLIHEDVLRRIPNGSYIAVSLPRRPIKAALGEPAFARRRRPDQSPLCG